MHLCLILALFPSCINPPGRARRHLKWWDIHRRALPEHHSLRPPNFPKLRNSIHSGARRCSLALLDPVPWPSTPKSLVACGQYNGRGSLEIYQLPSTSASENSTTVKSSNKNSYFRNRTSASSSKILSLTPHGTRLVYSDGNCMLTWVERDGLTLVRRWPINQNHAAITSSAATADTRASPPYSHGIFTSSAVNYSNRRDFERKLLRTGPNSTDEVVLWTGKKIGLVRLRDAVLGDELQAEGDEK